MLDAQFYLVLTLSLIAMQVICKPTSSVMVMFAKTILQLFCLGITVIVEPKMFAILVTQLHRISDTSSVTAIAHGVPPHNVDTPLRFTEDTAWQQDSLHSEGRESLDIELEESSPLNLASSRMAHLTDSMHSSGGSERSRIRGPFAAITDRISRVVSKTVRTGTHRDARVATEQPRLRRVTPVLGLLSQSKILRDLSESASHPSTTDLVSLRGPMDIKINAASEAQEMADALHDALEDLLPDLSLATDADVHGGRSGCSALEWMREVELEGRMTTIFGGKLVAWVAQQAPQARPFVRAHDAESVPRDVALVLDAVVTLGGDGTMLWACKIMGNHPVPPVVPFAMGSLGFMTPFSTGALKPVLQVLHSLALLSHNLNYQCKQAS